MINLTTRLHVLSMVLDRKMPEVLAAIIALVEAILDVVGIDLARERLPTAPVTLTAEQVLEAARARGISAFGAARGERKILLASIPGIYLHDPWIRAALLEMHHRREIRLVSVDAETTRADLAARGLSPELVRASILSDGAVVYHAILMTAEHAPVTAREGPPLTAERVLREARAHGVLAWGATSVRMILLATIPGVDLNDPGDRAQLLDLHRRGEIRLVRIEPIDLARVDLASRGHRPALLDESAIGDGDAVYHAIVLPEDAGPVTATDETPNLRADAERGKP